MADTVAPPFRSTYVRFRPTVCYVTGWPAAMIDGCIAKSGNGYGIITAGLCTPSALVWTNWPASLVRESLVSGCFMRRTQDAFASQQDFFGRSTFSPTDAAACKCEGPQTHNLRLTFQPLASTGPHPWQATWVSSVRQATWTASSDVWLSCAP